MPNVSYTQPLGASVKAMHIGHFSKYKKTNKLTATAQNSTFANRTSQHTVKVCKRAVFFAFAPA
jgi:hypothetical protein